MLIPILSLLLVCLQGFPSPVSEERSPDPENNYVNLEETQNLDSLFYDLKADTGRNYVQARQFAVKRRAHWKGLYKNAVSDSAKDKVLTLAGKDLEDLLIKGLFPFWYGTAWDFNGYTNVPGEGKIACGYFVSTTLKHAGFVVNRYRLAQQSAKKACNVLACTIPLKHVVTDQVEVFKKSCTSLEEGLYAIGLDYHIGFLLYRKGRFFFIHSTFVGADGVILEKIEDSPAFYSTSYYVGTVSTNRLLIKKWLLEEEILVPKN